MENIIYLIPAYNEGKTIRSVVSAVKKDLADIVVIDDGSADNTAEESEKAGAIVLKHNRNLGKGAALKTGFNYILENYPSAEAVITMDGDGQHSPADIKFFLKAWENQKPDFIIGARDFRSVNIPFLRRLWNQFISFLISVIIRKKIRDSQSGFRLIGRNLVSKIISDLRTDDYRVESEMIFCAAEHGVGIIEIPIQSIFNKRSSLAAFLKNNLRLLKILSFVLKMGFISFPRRSGISLAQTAVIIIGVALFVYLLSADYSDLKKSSGNNFQYSQEMIDALVWLKNNSKPDDIVLSEWSTGHQVVALADRRVVATSKVYPSEAQEVAARYKDLTSFFFASSEGEAKKILEKYNVSWVFVKKNFDNFIGRYINVGSYINICARSSSLISKILKGGDFGIISKVYESQNFLIYRVAGNRKISEPTHFYSGAFDAELIKKGFRSVGSSTGAAEQVYGLILPHHYPYVNYLLADSLKAVAPPEIAVLIGPDHQGITSAPITTSLGVWETPFGPLAADEKLIKLLNLNNIPSDNGAQVKEWSLRTIFPYLKYVFPQVKIVPILINNSASSSEINNLARFLVARMPAKTLYILSMDFVHKLTVEEAEKEDAKTTDAIKSFNKAEIGNLDMDAQAGLRLFLDVMEKRGAKSADLVRYSNVYEEQNQHPEFKPYSYLVTYMTWIFAK